MKLPRDLSGQSLVKHLSKHWDTSRFTRSAATLFCKLGSLRLIASLFLRIIH